MAILLKQFKSKFFELIPLILLLIISLSGNSVINFSFFSININFILIYFFVLTHPKALGYGFIFLAGIITDVVFGLPLGINALTLLVIASVAAYIRVVTVRISLFVGWVSFIPALLIANFVNFFSLYFSNYTIDYLHLFSNSIFTFIFYPLLGMFFMVLSSLMKQ